MEAQGLNSLFPMDRLSVMGFVEPLKRLPELLRIRGTVYRHFRDNPPDLFLGIDSPDFNLHLEQKLRSQGIPTAHLVSPSVWAWRQGRIRKIKRAIDLMLCLFPFETGIYQEHGIAVEFVGHPMADEIPDQVNRQAARQDLGLSPSDKVLAILPGSREGEVRMLAPLFLQAATLLRNDISQLSLVIPAANAARMLELEQMVAQYPQLPVTLVDGRSREVMSAADSVLLASGTATLEATLLKRPMVVAYRLAALTWFLVKRLATTPFAALPNILAGRAVVPELIQDDATAEAMAAALKPLLTADASATEQLQVFEDIHRDLSRDYAKATADALIALVEGGEKRALG